MVISAADVRAAEHEARQQRLRLAYLLRTEESKAPTAASLMHLRRIVAAEASRSTAYDQLMSDRETQKLFDCGALFFTRPTGC